MVATGSVGVLETDLPLGARVAHLIISEPRSLQGEEDPGSLPKTTPAWPPNELDS